VKALLAQNDTLRRKLVQAKKETKSDYRAKQIESLRQQLRDKTACLEGELGKRVTTRTPMSCQRPAAGGAIPFCALPLIVRYFCFPLVMAITNSL
jgi:hypothetical protein